MRKSLFFSVAVGLIGYHDAYAGKVSNYANVSAATSHFSSTIVQNIVQGKVIGPEGSIVGATVIVVGTKMSTITDAAGNFNIATAAGSTLRISNIGYKPKEIRVVSNTISVVLEFDESALEEVVVVGYGQQKKTHLTGAVSSVNVDKVMGGRPISDAGRGLQGVVPGLSVVVPSGEVGSDAILRIRGQVGSPLGSSNPLILVDNVEIPSLQLINPSDIETISVLKDAASASIYGSRAAFGVILITTKKGAKTDSNRLTYNNNFSWQTPFKKIELAGIEGLEYTVDAHDNMKAAGPAGGFWRVDRNSLEKIREWQNNYGGVIGNNDPVVYGRDWFWDGTQKFGYRMYDPVAAMIKDRPFSQQHNIGLNGKSGNTSYNLSLGYLGQQGMMKPAPHDDFRRINSTLKISTDLSDKVTIRGGVLYSDGTKRYPNSTNSTGFAADPWLYLYRWSRLFPIGVQENGKDIIDPEYSARTSTDAVDNTRYLNLNFGTTINFTKKWDLQADYTFSTKNNDLTSSVPALRAKTHWYGADPLKDENGNQISVDEQGNPVTSGGMLAYEFPMTDFVLPGSTYYSEMSQIIRKHTFNAFSTYRLDVNDDHHFKFMVGTNIIANNLNGHTSKQSGLYDWEDPFFNFADGVENANGTRSWDSQAAFFGRVNYAFKDKYLFEANLRRDASSLFPDYMRWTWYPSFSGGWVLSNENFMKSLDPVISFAKLRASWGSIGDQSISNGLYMPEMSAGGKTTWVGSAGTPTVLLGTPRLVGDGLTWQDIEHLNIGADLRFFKNKLGVTAEWFQRETNNMIIAGDVLPATLGTSSPNGNYGNLRTRGWELEIDFNHRFNNGLGLNISANVSDAVTMTTNGADFRTPWEDRLLSTTFSTGRRYGDVYGFVTDRLFQAEDFIYDDNGKFAQTNIVYNGTSKLTNMLAGDNPVYQTYFEDGNQTLLISPGDVKFKDINGDGYIDAGKGTNGDAGDRVLLGNSTPRYQYGFRIGADWKGFDMAVFVQGVGSRKIWGSGQLAIPGYSAKEGAMPRAIAEDYWRADRTDAFYPRAWNLNGADEGFVMRTQSRYMLNMAYIRIKNITFGYSVPKTILDRVKMSNARIFISLENMFTFDKLRGLPIDPEAISGVSMLKDSNYNLGRTGASNPTFKSASMGVQIGF